MQKIFDGELHYCFPVEEFQKYSFDAESFITTQTKISNLNSFRDDLKKFQSHLKSIVIDLVNNDYQQFVTLSSHLVKLENAFSSTCFPVNEVEVSLRDIHRNIDQFIAQIRIALEKKHKIASRKSYLVELKRTFEVLQQMEAVLFDDDDKLVDTIGDDELSRVVVELIFLKRSSFSFSTNENFLFEKRIETVMNAYLSFIEKMFISSFETQNSQTLLSSLLYFSCAEQIHRAEIVFRKEFVSPYLRKYINEVFLQQNSLSVIYEKCLDFLPLYGSFIQNALSNSSVKFDFLTNCLFLEIVSQIENTLSSIFLPTMVQTFHSNYTATLDFLETFENLCIDENQIENLRSLECYSRFLNRFSLPVYTQLRFREIVSDYESKCSLNLNSEGNIFKYQVLSSLWTSVARCWSKEVYITTISGKLYRLSLLLLRRYIKWLHFCIEECTSTACDTNLKLMAFLIKDIGCFSTQLKPYFISRAWPNLENFASHLSLNEIEAVMEDMAQQSQIFIPQVVDALANVLISKMVPNIRCISEIPRLYRHTNRAAPKQPSSYVNSLLEPLSKFIEEFFSCDEPSYQHAIAVCTSVCQSLSQDILQTVSDLFTSVQKMDESIKRLRSAKMNSVKGFTSSESSNELLHSLDDSDKIHLQVYIDITYFIDTFKRLGVTHSEVKELSLLEDKVSFASNLVEKVA